MVFMKNKIPTQAYIYIWVELSTKKWYLGCRYAVGCHPDDGYICSSKIVKPLIQNNPDNWKRTVLFVHDWTVIRKLEIYILTLINAKDDTMSYNKCNGNGYSDCTGRIILEKTREKLRKSLTGRKDSDDVRKKKSLGKIGTKKSPESKQKQRIKMTGVKKSESHRKNMSIAVINTPKKLCEFCNNEFSPMSYQRWHGENCKHNPNTKLIDRVGEKKLCEHCGGLFKLSAYGQHHGEKCKNNPANINNPPVKRKTIYCEHCNKDIAENTFSRFHGDNCKENPKNIGMVRELPKFKCEHCGTMASISLLKRWHGDDCKHKY